MNSNKIIMNNSSSSSDDCSSDDDNSSTMSNSNWSYQADNDDPVESNKVVLVTGGAGFIGSHTAQRLLARGDKVVVVDEMNDYYDLRQKRRNLEILAEEAGRDRLIVAEANICDREVMDKLFSEHKINHVVHLAARAGVRPSIDDPFIYVQTNVMGTVTLMELAVKYKVVNFVYASSSSVYGGSLEERFSEENVVDTPVSQYAATKKSCELFAATYNSLYGLNCTGLRFFTVYGPRGRPDMAPFKFIHRVTNGVTIDQYGDGSSERDYTYIDDIVDGVILSVDTPLGNEVLNLGRGTPCSLRHFIRGIESVCGRDAQINVMPMQPGDVPRTCADTSKAERLLGYRAKVPLEKGLHETCKWYQEWQSASPSC